MTPAGNEQMTQAAASRLRGLAPRPEKLVAGLAATFTVAVGSANGGYFPTTWGWTGIALGWIALLVLLLRDDAVLSPLAVAFVAAALAFVGWVALSALWSVDLPQTVLEVERDVVYVAGALALLLVRRAHSRALLAGLLTGVVALCGYALLTRLLPDRLGVFDPIAVYRLSEPIGYWNALGLFAAMGTLLAIGFVASAESPVARGFAGASPVVLLPTLQFTFSRGAWIALGVGLAAVLVLDPRRLRYAAAALLCAAPAAIAIAVGWRSEALTTGTARLDEAAHDGHRLLVLLVVLALAGAALGVAAGYVVRAWVPRAEGQVATRWVAAAALVGALAYVTVAFGSPAAIASRAWDAFSAPPAQRASANLNERLFSFSGSGRVTQWRVAADQVEDHPAIGSGAGTYEQYWLLHRPVSGKVRDAHNLYLEVLAELGPVGLALLVALFSVPLAAAWRARGEPLVGAATGAYLAYVVHAAVDWDWEMLVLTLLALACGATIVTAAAGDRAVRVRAPAAAVAGAAIVVAFVGLLGNVGASRAADALRAGEWGKAASRARDAERWAPWSADAPRLLGEARLAQGEFAAARDAFRTAIDRNPKAWESWFDLARATTGTAQLRALDRASRLNPRSPEIAEFRRELAQGWVLLDEVQA